MKAPTLPNPARHRGGPPRIADEPTVELRVLVPQKLLRKVDAEADDSHLTRSVWVRRLLEDAVDPESVRERAQVSDPREMNVAELREVLAGIDPLHDTTQVLVEVVTPPAGLGALGPRKERLVALSAKRGYSYSGAHPLIIRCERDA